MKALKTISLVLVIIGGLNWGLVGFFGYDLVAGLFGATALTTLVYDLVGLAAIVMIFTSFKKTA